MKIARIVAGVALLGVVPHRALSSQPSPACSTVVSRAGLADAGGARIRSVRVVTQPPRRFAGPLRVLERLHARTRPATVERELLFAAGDTVDTLRVAASLRRLRALKFLEDVTLTSIHCDAPTASRDGDGAPATVDLTVETRDVWSTVPEGHWTAVQQTLGLHENNLLGTGRTMSAVLRWDADRLGDGYRFGAQLALADPALTPAVAAGASVVAYADGRAWGLAVGSRTRSLADPWIARASAGQALRAPREPGTERIRRDRTEVVGGRRVTRAEAASTLYLLAGAQGERDVLTAGAGDRVLGPRAVRRGIVGPVAGVARRAARFDTLTWLLPGGGIADVARGTELEILAGVGRDPLAGGAAGDLGAWTGRVWLPRARALVATDLWATGRAARTGGLAAAALRIGVVGFRGTGDGRWTARLGGERLLRPDPDTRAFLGFDPTATLVEGEARLAATTATALLERSTRVRPVSRTLMLEGALFAAGSRRWRTASSTRGDGVSLGVVGVGVHLAPTRPGPPTAGLDLVYPAIGPPGVRGRPVVRVSLAPWFASVRGR